MYEIKRGYSSGIISQQDFREIERLLRVFAARYGKAVNIIFCMLHVTWELRSLVSMSLQFYFTPYRFIVLY